MTDSTADQKSATSATVLIGPDGLEPVLVVMRLATRTLDLVGVVNTDQPNAVGRVQGQWAVESVRLLWGCRHLMNDEANPIPRLVDDQYLTVQVQQRIQR